MGQTILEYLSQYDEGGEGRLPKKVLKRAVKEMSREFLGLTRIQIASVLSLPEAAAGDGGMVDLAAFVPACASTVQGILSVDKARQRADAMAKFAQTDSARVLARFDQETIQRVLIDAFIEHDKDGSGALDPVEAENLLRSAGIEQLGLKPREIDAILAAMDEDSDGLIYYDELSNFLMQGRWNGGGLEGSAGRAGFWPSDRKRSSDVIRCTCSAREHCFGGGDCRGFCRLLLSGESPPCQHSAVSRASAH